MTFTSIDYDKFRQLRVTHIAARLEELIGDEANWRVALSGSGSPRIGKRGSGDRKALRSRAVIC